MVNRVLICGLTSNRGGTESYVMSIYRNIDRTIMQFDFLCIGEKRMAYEDEVKAMGGNVYYAPLKRDGVKEQHRLFKEIFNNNHYIGVYYQTTHGLQSLDVFKIALKNGVKYRAIHSHSTSEEKSGVIASIRRKLALIEMDKYVNMLFACSKEAGEWMFPGKEFSIIKNSIDTELFSYSPAVRDEIIKELGLSNKRIVGTVASFTYPKNPEFLVDIVDNLLKINNEIVFIHLGTGPLETRIKEEVEKRGIVDRYLFIESKPDVYRYLNAMDVFVLPSRYEGFPISYIEAQASGVRCIISDVVTRASDLTDNTVFLKANDNAEEWARIIDENLNYERKDMSLIIKNLGYDIKDTVNHIYALFGVEN